MTRENYFAILLDRATGGPVVIASPKGGAYNISCIQRLVARFFF
jgi:succinyl-CoA synthetase beta subunit